jgi:ribosome biogenesis GTPase A
VGLFAAEFFLSRYAGLVRAHFKLDEAPPSPADLLLAIGRKRGCLRSGGVVDLHKAADILVHEFRAGALGRISLEAPGDLREAPEASELSE